MSSDHPVSVHDCVLPSCGLRARLFYPCAFDLEAPRAPWFPPSATLLPNENALGLAEFLEFPFPSLSWPVLSAVLRDRLPVQHDAPIGGKFPLALFSHGLGGSLAGYPSFCSAIAMRGYVVVAVEHADGSAFAAYTGAERTRVPYLRAQIGGEDFELRQRQLEQRVRELGDARDDMRAISEGSAMHTPLPGFGTTGKTVDLLDKIDVEAPLIVTGHSFGGGTALAFCDAVSKGEISAQVAYAICLDPWLYPLGREMATNFDHGEAKVLFVDQELSEMTSSLALRRVLPGGNYWSVKVVGGGHNNSSDLALRLPLRVALASKLTPPNSSPQDLMNSQNDACVAFIDEERWQWFENEVAHGIWRGLALSHLPDSVADRVPGPK